MKNENIEHIQKEYRDMIQNQIVMKDRKNLTNRNGLIFGAPGSGKGFATKMEIVSAFIETNDDIIIADPYGEYVQLTKELGGQVIKLSSKSKNSINPMEIVLGTDNEEYEQQISLKKDLLISICNQIAGGNQGFTNCEMRIVDHCIIKVYRKYKQAPNHDNMPIFDDLLSAIKEQEDAEAKRIVVNLELFIKDNPNFFSHRTNIEINNRLVCFDINDLSLERKQMAIPFLLVLEALWNRLKINAGVKKNTWCYIDEFGLLLADAISARYFNNIWKRVRLWGGIFTGIMQSVKSSFSSHENNGILENSGFIIMLKQVEDDFRILSKKLGFSEQQLHHVTKSGEGKGVLFLKDEVIPFEKVKIPNDTKLYSIMTCPYTQPLINLENPVGIVIGRPGKGMGYYTP